MTGHANALHNYLQDRQQAALLTWSENSLGPCHDISWTVECKIAGVVKGKGVAPQKAAAKELAAQEALQALTRG